MTHCPEEKPAVDVPPLVMRVLSIEVLSIERKKRDLPGNEGGNLK